MANSFRITAGQAGRPSDCPARKIQTHREGSAGALDFSKTTNDVLASYSCPGGFCGSSDAPVSVAEVLSLPPPPRTTSRTFPT